MCADGRSPWQVILDVGDAIDAGVIVAGIARVRRPTRARLGGQARALAQRARRPLLLLPVDASPAGAGVPAIFAYDGSASAGDAARAATQLLRPRPAIVATVWLSASHAVGVARLALPDEVARRGTNRLDEASHRQAEGEACDGAALLAAAGWPCATAALETPRNVPMAIIGAADEHDAAIVVTGTRGRSRIAAALLGSSAEGILRHAERPLLLVSPSG